MSNQGKGAEKIGLSLFFVFVSLSAFLSSSRSVSLSPSLSLSLCLSLVWWQCVVYLARRTPFPFLPSCHVSAKISRFPTKNLPFQMWLFSSNSNSVRPIFCTSVRPCVGTSVLSSILSHVRLSTLLHVVRPFFRSSVLPFVRMSVRLSILQLVGGSLVCSSGSSSILCHL